MSRRLLSRLALCWGLLAAAPAGAIDDAQYQAIRALGQLNGVALHCKFLDQTRHMKEALVAALPKRRALGDAFDRATDEAYLAFLRQPQACPTPATFAEQVGRGIEALRVVFPAATPVAP